MIVTQDLRPPAHFSPEGTFLIDAMRDYFSTFQIPDDAFQSRGCIPAAPHPKQLV
jgi:hypothetical protein